METPQEIAQLRDYILFLELENTCLALENANLKDYIEQHEEPKYN